MIVLSQWQSHFAATSEKMNAKNEAFQLRELLLGVTLHIRHCKGRLLTIPQKVIVIILY